MRLLESLDCKKGITLNSQLVDLLSIIDESIPPEEQDKKIQDYIASLEKRQNEYIEASEQGVGARHKYLVDATIDANESLSPEQREQIKSLYLSNLGNIYDSSKMQQILQSSGFEPSINETVLKDLKNIDYTAKEGVLSLTPEKVRAFYSHLFNGDKNTYDRVTFDNAGKYSLYVSVDGKTYANERLDKMVQFCEKHGMKSKINTFMFYCDFPKLLETHLQTKVDSGEITEDGKKEALKESLMGYVEHIGKTYGDRIDAVDIFNELIYDPHMKEEGFDELPTYHQRTEGWQKYLSTRDLCEMALMARKLMPNATFTYNDMNWVEPKKRKEMIKVVQEIQQIEQEYREQGKLGENESLIDNIGFEAHLTTGVKTKQIEKAFEEVTKKLRLPIEVTELDCARTGEDPLSKVEISKQRKVFSKITEMAKKYKCEALTIWSQSDELSFMNDKCQRKVYASMLDDNFEEKDISPVMEYDEKKRNIFKSIISRISGKGEKTLPPVAEDVSQSYNGFREQLESTVKEEYDDSEIKHSQDTSIQRDKSI